MDIFGTTVTAGSMIIQFLDACSEFSSDAESLKIRLEWDLHALKTAQQYFSTPEFNNRIQLLEPEEAALLKHTSTYLDNLVKRVHKAFRKIERKDLLQHTINKTTWIMRRSQIQEIQREVHEWRENLNLRVLSLPKQVRTSITTAYGKRSNAQQSSVISSGNRVQEFLALSATAKQSRVNELLLRCPEKLIARIQGTRDISSLPFQDGSQQIIFCSRQVSAKNAPGTPGFEVLVSEMGELAATLHCLDPVTDVRILKVNYYFYHSNSNQFLFAQVPPYRVDSTMTLREFIQYDPFPGTQTTLNARLKIAYKLAEAVFFLHIAGFCHKNITSRSVVILRRFESEDDTTLASSTIDEAYLMGFDLIRGIDAKTYKEGTRNRDNEEPSRTVWDFDIFQHSTRLEGNRSLRYATAHDIYSLGVVLLELGFWKPLQKVVGRIDENDPSSWTQEFIRVAPSMSHIVGERYNRIVEWCLSLPGDRNVKDIEFMQNILDPLEEIVNALT
ncbi:hypothetical protein M434DRAFT_28402 [Hypoxylon sp. CO27-5]|nr:hypothetical protein M434DRAFT_28402 [Hypoxylon sp. CO27-5]